MNHSSNSAPPRPLVKWGAVIWSVLLLLQTTLVVVVESADATAATSIDATSSVTIEDLTWKEQVAVMKARIELMIANHSAELPLKWHKLANRFLAERFDDEVKWQEQSELYQQMKQETDRVADNLQWIYIGVKLIQAASHYYRMYNFLEDSKTLLAASGHFLELNQTLPRVMGALNGKLVTLNQTITAFNETTSAERAQKMHLKLKRQVRSVRDHEYREACDFVRRMHGKVLALKTSEERTKFLTDCGKVALALGAMAATVYTGRRLYVNHQAASKLVEGASKAVAKQGKLEALGSFVSNRLDGKTVAGGLGAAAGTVLANDFAREGARLEDLIDVLQDQVNSLDDIQLELDNIDKAIVDYKDWITAEGYDHLQELLRFL